MPSHYTAVIEIVKVAPPMGGERGKIPPEKDKTEIARIVIRADSLKKLVSKAGKHLDLVEEEDQ